MISNILQEHMTALPRLRIPLRIGVLLMALTMSACVAPPPRERVVARPAPEAETDVYVYPSNGQSEAQTDRDRYECHEWAVAQSHYDPSRTNPDASERVVVRTAPAGANTAAGAITGGVLGAIVAGPRNAPGGAIVGAVAGAMVGAAADTANEEHTERVQERYDRRHGAAVRRAQSYRRAISACLEGRGYTVK